MGGHLLIKELREIFTLSRQNPEQYKNFVETGTYHGDTTREAEKLFPNVYTIEINETLYSQTKPALKEHTHAYLGDSLKILPTLIEELNGPTVWFLDAHQSGYDTSNNGKNVPLLEELDIILNGSLKCNQLLIIDDVRLFSNAWDWAGITTNNIVERCSLTRRVALNFVYNDRFIVVLE